VEGKSERFARLEEFLPYAKAARQLSVPEGTLKSEVNRLKKRYRDLLRSAIAHTVSGTGKNPN